MWNFLSEILTKGFARTRQVRHVAIFAQMNILASVLAIVEVFATVLVI
jgi:hypothetical protein